MSITENKRGIAGWLPSWTENCGGNPSINEILDDLDQNINARTMLVIGMEGLHEGVDYLCTGVDDQLKLIQAVNDAQGIDGYVKIKMLDATYHFSAPGILKDNIILEGESKFGTILRLDDNTNTAILENDDQVNGNPGIHIKTLTVDGNRDNQDIFDDITYPTFQGAMIQLIGGGDNARYKYEDVYAINGAWKGLYMQEVNASTMKYCDVHNCTANGLDIFKAYGNKIYGNTVDTIHNFVGIIANRDCKYNIIVNNTVHTTSDDGIQIRGYFTDTPLDINNINWQSGNIVRYTFNSSPDLSAIVVGQEVNFRSTTNLGNSGVFPVTAFDNTAKWIEIYNVNVSSNATDETASPGLAMIDPEYSEHNIVMGNTIHDVGLGPNLDGSIARGQALFLNEFGNRRNIVIGNQVDRAGINGVKVSVFAREQSIVDNIINYAGYNAENTGSDAAGEGTGISFNNNGQGHTVKGNKIFNSWRGGLAIGDFNTIQGNTSVDNGRKGSGSQYGFSFGAENSVMGNVAYDTRSGANRTQQQGYVSSKNNNIIFGNKAYNNATADYVISGSNRLFFDDTTSTFYGKTGNLNFAANVDARGFNVNGIKLQAVNASGGLGGYWTRESSDVFSAFMNRQTTNASDVLRYYIKNNSSGVDTLVGGATGDITSRFYWQFLKAIVAVETDLINERTSGAGVTIDGVLVKDSGIHNVVDPTLAQDVATKAYADSLVVGLIDDRGNYDASSNLFPSTGGSGTAGAILKGDLWFISVAGTLGGVAVNIGDQVRALANTPGQTSSNWAVSEANLGYTPENSANKDTDSTFSANSDIKYPSQKAVKTAMDLKANAFATTRVVTAAGAITITTADYLVIANKTVGAATIVNLPATPETGRVYRIKDGKGDAQTNNITITPNSGTIDGATTQIINANYGTVDVIYNGTEWNIF